MNKKKISFLLLSCLILGQVYTPVVQAQPLKSSNAVVSTERNSKLTKEELKSKLEEMGVEVLYIKDKTPINNPSNSVELESPNKRKPIKVNSLNEIQSIVNDLRYTKISKSPSSKSNEVTSSDRMIKSFANLEDEIKEGSGTVSKWSPIGGGVDIGDFEVGAKINGTWEFESVDINDYI